MKVNQQRRGRVGILLPRGHGKPFLLIAGLSIVLAACTSPAAESVENAEQVALCKMEYADDLLEYCGEAFIYDPYSMCGPSDQRISPPEGYVDSPEYAATFSARCVARKFGQDLRCHAQVCKDLFSRYATSGAQPVARVMARLFTERHDWCDAESAWVGRDEACRTACTEQTGYSDAYLLLDCHVSTWAECSTCAQNKYDAYTSCESKCAVEPCSNGTRDGVETDVDCGGGTCRGCLTGKQCSADGDCQSKHCEQGHCAAATCSDGIRNQLESDVDCGAWCGKPCQVGQHCADNVDCASSNCSFVGVDIGLGTCE